MKRCFVLLALLLISAPCWAGEYREIIHDKDHFRGVIPAQEPEIHRLHPGGAYIDTRQKYETKIIPEVELEGYLNQGWEFVHAYSVLEYTYWPGRAVIVNKAIIRREKP